MLRRLTAICLLIALTSSNCSRLFVFVGFEVNQNYIAANLCINKVRPWVHCHGKCYLMRKIRQAEENEKKQAAKDAQVRYEISYFQEAARVDLTVKAITKLPASWFPVYGYHYKNVSPGSIFQPPRQVI